MLGNGAGGRDGVNLIGFVELPYMLAETNGLGEEVHNLDDQSGKHLFRNTFDTHTDYLFLFTVNVCGRGRNWKRR